MGLIVLEGFDHYSTAAQAYLKPSLGGVITGVSTSGGRFDSGYISQTAIASRVTIALPGANYNELWVGFGVRSSEATPTASNYYGFLQCHQPSGTSVSFALNSSYGIDVSRYNSSVLGSTDPGIVTYNVWHYFEAYIKMGDGTDGAVTVKLDGNQELALTSIDNRYYPGEDIQYVSLSACNNQKTMDFDDLYVHTSKFLGDIKVVTKLPDADGSYSDFTPLSGSNYENVDETTPDDDTSYNVGAAVGDQDSFTIPTTGIDGEIAGVQLSNYVKKTGTKATGIKNLVRVGGSNYLGDEEFLATEYAYKTTIHEDNPDTSNPWGYSELGSAEFGIEVTSLSTTTTTTTV